MPETDSELAMFLHALSRILGWAYFLSWSVLRCWGRVTEA
jgi:cystinosin